MTKKTKVNWLDRTLFTGGYLTLVTSQEEFEAALRELNIPVEGDTFVVPGMPAVTRTYTNVGGSVAAIVGLDMALAAEQEPIDVAALLVHEAVHVWQGVEERAGRMGCFGNEGEAYFIQNIAARLMQAYADKLK